MLHRLSIGRVEIERIIKKYRSGTILLPNSPNHMPYTALHEICGHTPLSFRIVGWRVSGRAQAGTLKSDALGRTTQMIVVTTSDVERVSDAAVSRYL
jgi:hypothetical protein